MRHGVGLWPLFAMWAPMMLAMMAPAEAPSAAVLVRTRGAAAGAAYLSATLAPWVVFSLLAALLQQALHGAGLLDHQSGAFANPLPCAALLVAAGALQISPWKRACAERCRAAARDGSFGAGLRAGALSVASCGALMLAPFAVGMAWWPMALLAALLVAERVAPERWRLRPVSGALLVVAGLFLAV